MIARKRNSIWRPKRIHVIFDPEAPAEVRGWTKLPRSLLYDPIFKNPNLLQVYIWCLLKATYKPYKALIGNRAVVLQPGKFITGRKVAALELGIHETTFRDRLKAVECAEHIAIKTTTKYSIVTIRNWSEFQQSPPTNRQQSDTYNKEKKKKFSKFTKDPTGTYDPEELTREELRKESERRKKAVLEENG